MIAAYGGAVADDDHFLISESLPKFKNETDLSLLSVLLESTGTEVVVIDPLYMCMGGSEASNIQAQGELLWNISDLCRKAQVTLVVAHHVTKAAARDLNRVLTLEDLTQAGFDAWAHQWWMVSRRESFELGSGLHKLLVGVGNCSSYSAAGIDIDEGTKDAPDGMLRYIGRLMYGRWSQQRRQNAQLASDIAAVQQALADGAIRKQTCAMAEHGFRRSENGTADADWRGIVKEIAGGSCERSPHCIGNRMTTDDLTAIMAAQPTLTAFGFGP